MAFYHFRHSSRLGNRANNPNIGIVVKIHFVNKEQWSVSAIKSLVNTNNNGVFSTYTGIDLRWVISLFVMIIWRPEWNVHGWEIWFEFTLVCLGAIRSALHIWIAYHQATHYSSQSSSKMSRVESGGIWFSTEEVQIQEGRW